MARIFSSGYELNSNNANVEWLSTTSAPSIQTTTVRSGTYAGQITSLSSGIAKKWEYDFAGAGSNGPLFFRFWLRVGTRPTGGNCIMRIGGSVASIAWIQLESTGKLALRDEDGAVGSESGVLNNDQWYMVEMEYDRTGAAGSHILKAKLDGTEFASATNRNLSGSVYRFNLGGNILLESQTTGDWYFDDIAINNNSGSFQNSYPGSGEEIHLSPNATGDNGDWVGGSGGDTGDYQDIDEVTPNDATDFLASMTSGEIEDVNLAATPAAIASDDVINCVQVGVRARIANATDPDPNACVRIKASASGTVEESADLGNGGTTFFTNSPSTPKTSPLTLYDLPGASTTAWTKADLDTTQIGIKETATDTVAYHVTTMWLLVDHKPTAAPATTTEPTGRMTANTLFWGP